MTKPLRSDTPAEVAFYRNVGSSPVEAARYRNGGCWEFVLHLPAELARELVYRSDVRVSGHGGGKRTVHQVYLTFSPRAEEDDE